MLGDAVEVILDGGPSAGRRPSTIVDCTGDRPRILREGALSAREITVCSRTPVTRSTTTKMPSDDADEDPGRRRRPEPADDAGAATDDKPLA